MTPSRDDMPDGMYEDELSRLKSQNEDLNAELQSNASKLEMSATIGKKLLESNQELQNKNIELVDEMEHMREDLEQKNHDLKKENERIGKNVTLNHGLEEENQTLKEVLDASRAGMEDAKREHRAEIKKLSEDLEKSNAALMQKELAEVQLQEKVARLEGELHDLEEASMKKFRAAESDEENAALREEMAMLETEARDSKFERDELSNRLARVELDCQMLDEQLTTRDEEIKSMEERYTEAYGSLREAKETISKLNDELAAANTLAASGGRKFGTDMFSEIEEKRERLEKQRFTLNRKIDRLRRELDLADHQKTQLRNQVSMLMHTRGNKADAVARQKLEQALSQKQSEYMHLGVINKTLENRITEGQAMIREHHRGASNFGDQRVYLEYLDSELEHRNVEIRRLKDEIRTKVLQTMNESEKLRKVQRSTHDSNLRNEQLMMTNMELKMKVDELTMKNASLQPIMYEAPAPASKLAGPEVDAAAPETAETPAPIGGNGSEAGSYTHAGEDEEASVVNDEGEECTYGEVNAEEAPLDAEHEEAQAWEENASGEAATFEEDDEIKECELELEEPELSAASQTAPDAVQQPAKITIADDKANECPTQ